MKNSTSVLLEDAKKGGVYEKKILYKTNVENEYITCQLLFF